MALSKVELVELVRKISEAEGTEEEIDAMLLVLENEVPNADISDLIFWSEEELTPEQIVDKALDIRPIASHGSESSVDEASPKNRPD